MFVRKIKSNKGIIEVGRYGVDRIDVHDDGSATYYTAGGNIFTVKVKKILNDDGIISNSKNHHKNLYWCVDERKIMENFYRITWRICKFSRRAEKVYGLFGEH